ncbi:MAG: ADP-glyceromanno-heptose 6-epimerase [Rhodospirillales bacterium]|nr:ADP-glyceromanno-heptose 6-epimerase [Alphaproteobacteria bacterium]USO03522.1 MAG: ADP-glyceromanno-heptose 6-epimerase [Rhodospirillales bacterium]
MIIVTGGAGFIGSNLVAGLEEHGCRDIVICDVLGSEGKWMNIAKREIRDVVHPDRLFDYLHTHAQDIEMIFHVGAISSTTERNADLIIDTNFVLSRRIWKWCGNNNVRLVYASSAATYGSGTNGFEDDGTIEGLAKLRPLNAYGWSKHVFDRRIARVVEEKLESIPPQWAGLKFFNVYGPNEYHKGEQMSVMCKLYPQVVAGAAAKLFKSSNPDYEDGGQLRDFVWVGDCVDVMLWLYDNKQVSGLFNVGSGEARSFKDLAEATFRAAGKEPKIQYIDMPEVLQAKYQYYTQADMNKLRQAGYDKPFTSLEEGSKTYVNDYMRAKDIYR